MFEPVSFVTAVRGQSLRRGTQCTCGELTEGSAGCVSFIGLQLQLPRSWLSTMTTVPSAGTPCRPRGNCPVDIFSTSRDWCSVQGVRVLFGPMLQTTPSKGWGIIPQSGCRAGRECCGKLWAVLLQIPQPLLYMAGPFPTHSLPSSFLGLLSSYSLSS